MTGPGTHSAGSRGSDHLLRYAALVAGVVAAAAIALASDDPRWLRLGVLAALWAALLAAFAVVRLRRDTADGAERAEAMRAVYRLELEREVLARREHELTVERDIRTKVEKEGRDELDAVRTELRTLRETLSQLLGGELLVERVALRAQSTRVRSLGEPNQQPAASRARGLPREQVQRPMPSDGVPDARQAEPVRNGFPRAEPVRTRAPVPAEQPAARWRLDVPGESPPLPRRDPDERTDPTLRRPRPQVPEPPEPLLGSGGRHEARRPTVAPSTASAERNGSHSESRRASDVSGGRRSVDDLLAAYGAEAGPRHRHRRAD